jgi:hypothetical protein
MPTKTSAGPHEVVRLEVLRLTPPLAIRKPRLFLGGCLGGVGGGRRAGRCGKGQIVSTMWHLLLYLLAFLNGLLFASFDVGHISICLALAVNSTEKFYTHADDLIDRILRGTTESAVSHRDCSAYLQSRHRSFQVLRTP